MKNLQKINKERLATFLEHLENKNKRNTDETLRKCLVSCHHSN